MVLHSEENIVNPTFKKKKTPFVLSNVALPPSGDNWEHSLDDFKNHSQMGFSF